MGVCRSCGGPLPGREGKRGRVSLYCSAACRQRAYRGRQGAGGDARELIERIGRRVRGLAPELPEPFYHEVTGLAGDVGRLRRIAQTAYQAALGSTSVPRPEAPATGAIDPGATGAASGTTGPGTADGGGRAQAVPEDVTDRDVTEPAGVPGAGAPEPESVTDAGVMEWEGDDGVADLMRDGDEWEFASLAEPYRGELRVHCYRMVGSYDDAEDLVQEALLKAWRSRDGFEGRASFRAWLYKIATNVCLDFLRRNSRRPARYTPVPGMEHGDGEPPVRITWLQPYPDRMLAEVVSPEAGPESLVVARETLELVFLAAIQHLPPRQRAVLILRDVLECPAARTAELLDMSVASVNSALQRARAALRERMPERRGEWGPSAETSPEEMEILRRYMAAAVAGDTSMMARMLAEDVVLTMPPNPYWFTSRDAVMTLLARTFDPASPEWFGRWRHLPTRANGRPAVAGYVQRPGTRVYRAQNIDVLRVVDGRIAEITTFEPHLLPAFGLPLTLPGEAG
ncbi:sigma-70 family RNA polymerase sigma factor [Bailinhaonella thermotolerans]|uniref:RNA polymerase sigma factor n=1 Tax=Bailinhaonella thermotolerans TaxID=1070861 RepID=A0A3A4AXI2_9ACTN|nr:sigma-70 family RNA polymerase sigma factor [Bailinhaonella thermotolerans]RJL30533.1 sigma-70 family RNA polymerase sigma factor [Bailinhaonella thermotolerans]